MNVSELALPPPAPRWIAVYAFRYCFTQKGLYLQMRLWSGNDIWSMEKRLRDVVTNNNEPNASPGKPTECLFGL
ncbi:hypothetical protein EVAR_73448_1 [Eumeta japonica]|uniref:Uncharacterized protein n=1 Tax=Eumeta variegata TaxID=151549 RepID=A0A4C1TKT1_EUMVA|nr:hypothetical protein EVAR_73448_1 [Eumeta japonica]